MTDTPPRHRDRPGRTVDIGGTPAEAAAAIVKDAARKLNGKGITTTVHIGGESIPVNSDGRIGKVRRQAQIPGTEEPEVVVPRVVEEAAEAWLAAVGEEKRAKEDTKSALANLEHHMTEERVMTLKIEDEDGVWWAVAIEGETKIRKAKCEPPKRDEKGEG